VDLKDESNLDLGHPLLFTSYRHDHILIAEIDSLWRISMNLLKYSFWVTLGLLLVSIECVWAGGVIPPPKTVKSDALVGAYYFPGWSHPERWYCISASEPTQHPLLGYYKEGDPDAADWHIKWALEHGISFFAFDFYTQNGSQMLEAALDDGFLKSKFIGQFKFCINWCNHFTPSTMTPESMERFGDLVIKKYLTHPSYLRIDNKPVVMILVGGGYVQNLGMEGAKKVFDRFEQRCKDAGLPGVYLVFCEGENGGEVGIKNSISAGTKAFCLYNYPYYGTSFTGIGKHMVAPYADLANCGEELWKHWGKITGNLLWPTVMPGWDRRPWTKDSDLIRTGSTPELFGKALERAKGYLNKDRVVMIEAWNEWGEGSILEPSAEYGFAYLDQVRRVFAPDSPKHKDVTPKSSGMLSPAFDLKLPRIDKWTFDFDTEGWTAVSCTELKQEWGNLYFTSVNGDPQINSPVTYLDCKKYTQMHIRMRAFPKDDSPTTTDGQLFWSTVESVMSEDTSIKFKLPLDGVWHDIELDLRSNPQWKGIADKFRLDPSDKEGIKFEIDEIRVMNGR